MAALLDLELTEIKNKLAGEVDVHELRRLQGDHRACVRLLKYLTELPVASA